MKETAIEIGKTCNLIQSENQIDCIDLASLSETEDNVEKLKNKIQKVYSKYIKVLVI